MTDTPAFTGSTKAEFDEWAYRHGFPVGEEITLPAAQYDALADDVLIQIIASHASNGYPIPRPDRSRSRLVCSGIRIYRDPPLGA